MKPSPRAFMKRNSEPRSRVTLWAKWSIAATAVVSPFESAKAVKSLRSQNRNDTSTAPSSPSSPALVTASCASSCSSQRRCTPVIIVSASGSGASKASRARGVSSGPRPSARSLGTT